MLTGTSVMKRWKIARCPRRAMGPKPLLRLLGGGGKVGADRAEHRTHPWESLLFVQGTLGLQG